MGKAQHTVPGEEKEPLALGSGKLNSHMQKMKLDHPNTIHYNRMEMDEEA